jgi:hypothetical protein
MKKKPKIFLFILLFIGGIVLLFLPKDFFDSGQSMCLSVVLLDMECYGCGMTRAIQHLIHFDFQQALHYNKLSLIVFPLFVVLIIMEFIKVLKEKEGTEKEKP